MKWIYQSNGGLTHVEVFTNGFRAGKLYFSTEEFVGIMVKFQNLLDNHDPKKVIEFIIEFEEKHHSAPEKEP